MTKEERKEYYQAHKEERKEYYQAHKEELKEYSKAYKQAHKEERKEYSKAYKQAHKKEVKEYSKAYHESNKERRLRKFYCCEEISKIENYELAKKDNFVDWDIHHRLETHNSDGEKRLVDLTADELKALGVYYNRPASELIFMKHGEHRSLHNLKGKKNENKKDKLQTVEQTSLG